MVETGCIQFCTKREAEESNGYSTSRHVVPGQTRVCEERERDISARLGGSIGA